MNEIKEDVMDIYHNYLVEFKNNKKNLVNLYDNFNLIYKTKSKVVFNHHPLIPNNFRMLIIGPSAAVKPMYY